MYRQSFDEQTQPATNKYISGYRTRVIRMQLILQTFLNPIFPIFAIMLVGIILAKRKIFDFAAAQTINKFVFYGGLPPLIFSLTSSAPLRQLNLAILALYFISEIGLFAITALIIRIWLKRNKVEAILLGMAACLVNHVFFIMPIAIILYGDQAMLPLSAVITIDVVVVFCGMIVALEIISHGGESYLKVAGSFLRNPVLVGMALGLLVNIAGIDLHEGIETFISFAGKAAPPAALFSLGIIMAEARIFQIDGSALLVTALKIIVHPLIIWLFFSWFSDLDTTWSKTILLTSAGPCGAMPFVLALQYKVKADSIGLAIVYSTVASLLTLSIIA